MRRPGDRSGHDQPRAGVADGEERVLDRAAVARAGERDDPLDSGQGELAVCERDVGVVVAGEADELLQPARP